MSRKRVLISVTTTRPVGPTRSLRDHHRLRVAVRAPGAHAWPRKQSLHRAPRLHRDSYRLLPRPRGHSDRHMDGKAPHRRRTHPASRSSGRLAARRVGFTAPILDPEYASATPRRISVRRFPGWSVAPPPGRERTSPPARSPRQSPPCPFSRCNASIATTTSRTLSKRGHRVRFVFRQEVRPRAALKASYSSGNEAAQKIPAALADFYQQ